MLWRERGYGIFQAIEKALKHKRTEYGYTSIRSKNLMICQGILFSFSLLLILCLVG
jgi:hypothetical protein